MLELLGRPEEVVGVSLGGDLARVRLLDVVLIALLLGKMNGGFLALEVDMSALHDIAR